METSSIEQTHGKKWACTARSPRYGSDANKKWRDNGKSPSGDERRLSCLRRWDGSGQTKDVAKEATRIGKV